jgi:hypothetical protein
VQRIQRICRLNGVELLADCRKGEGKCRRGGTDRRDLDLRIGPEWVGPGSEFVSIAQAISICVLRQPRVPVENMALIDAVVQFPEGRIDILVNLGSSQRVEGKPGERYGHKE